MRQLIKSFYRTVDMCKVPVLPVMKSKQTSHNDSSSDDSQGFFEDSQGRNKIENWETIRDRAKIQDKIWPKICQNKKILI